MKNSASEGSFKVFMKGLDFEAEKKSLTESWNLFVFSLVRTVKTYYNARKVMLGNHFSKMPSLARWALNELRKIPLLKLFLAALPYASYLILFSFNGGIRHVTHLDEISQPHLIILSQVEKTLFSCQPHKILSRFANPIFDVIAAVPYLIHFPLPFLFLLYLVISEKRREAALPYLWCVGWVNLVAVIIQTTFPTAPPWFADSAVLDRKGHIIFESPSEGGFSRLDGLLGIHLFHGLYSTSPLKFGAFPSLHVALPMVIFLNHPWLGKKFGAFHVILITLSAIYITHHYLVDALGGILLACIVRWCILKVWSPFGELRPVGDSESSSSSSSSSPRTSSPSEIV